MDGSEIFEVCLTQSTSVIKQLRPDHLGNATPDSEWNVRDLLTHMLNELQSVPDVLNGLTEEDRRSNSNRDITDYSAIEIITEWQNAADEAEAASSVVDLEEQSYFNSVEISNDKYLQLQAIQQFIYAWDLGKSIGVPLHFDLNLIDQLYQIIQSQPESAESVVHEHFTKALDVPQKSDMETRLLALLGRDINWRPL